MSTEGVPSREPTSGNQKGTRTLSTTSFFALVAVAVLAVLLATAAVVASVREDVKVADLRERIEEGTVEEAAYSANDDPANRHVTLTSGDGQIVDIVLLEEGTGFVVGTNLPKLDTNAYQLWADVGDKAVSVAFLGREIEPASFRLPETSTSLFVTTEQLDGAITPSNAVVTGRIITE